MADNKPVDDLIIIGIDFGTTYSGMAWAYSQNPGKIHIVTSWKSQQRGCSDTEKAPTQLLYDKGKATSWGYSIPLGKDALKWFKLLLLDEDDVPSETANSPQLCEAKKLLKKNKKDEIEVVACFLRKLWNHGIDSIRDTVGADLLQKSKFHVVITLPAIWPPYAQQRMKQAAKASGILEPRPCGETKLRFISEPEAAALATLQDVSTMSTIKPGDTLVICDAGGGTVDLISYAVESSSPFVVKECVGGDGGLCGGMFLDEGFIKLMKKKTSKASWSNVTKAEEKKFLNKEWEHAIKIDFQKDEGMTWSVDLPAGCDGTSNKLKRRRSIELSSEDILSVFTPVVDKVKALVRRQTQTIQTKYGEPAKFIILVGGFGRNGHLFDELKASAKVTVLQSRGTSPWTAICRGAVIHGVNECSLSANPRVTVKARICRRSYGIRYSCPFIPGVHRGQDKYWNEEYQAWWASNQMKWFLREGDDIDNKSSKRRSYSRLLSDQAGQISQTILSCSTFTPPQTFGPTVQELCEVHWTRDINIESLPTWTNTLGKVYHKLEYDIEMTCDDGTVDFNVYFQGKVVAFQNVEVEFK